MMRNAGRKDPGQSSIPIEVSFGNGTIDTSLGTRNKRFWRADLDVFAEYFRTVSFVLRACRIFFSRGNANLSITRMDILF